MLIQTWLYSSTLCIALEVMLGEMDSDQATVVFLASEQSRSRYVSYASDYIVASAQREHVLFCKSSIRRMLHLLDHKICCIQLSLFIPSFGVFPLTQAEKHDKSLCSCQHIMKQEVQSCEALP